MDQEWQRWETAREQGIAPEPDEVAFARAEREPVHAGRVLWKQACARIAQGQDQDDRWLYWQRAGMLHHLQKAGASEAELMYTDCASRGAMEPIRSEPSIIVTGFDPFRLKANLAQSNPSGLVALSLAEQTLGDMVVHTCILPVRFDAFDIGMVETILTVWCEDVDVRMIVTVSMGRDGFDLERFPAGCRSSEEPDNAGMHGGGSPDDPLILHPDGPGFAEFSLPVEAMMGVSGPWPVRDNREVQTLEGGRFQAQSLAELEGQTPVAGSGGGYLSNEVAYRTLRFRDEHAPGLAVGHIHTPRIDGCDLEAEREIVDQVKRMLEAAGGALKVDG